jgi:hypothetical protein
MPPVIRPALAMLVALACAPLAAAEIQADGILRGRAGEVASQPPWIEGGFGKLTDGAAGPDAFEARFDAEAHLGLDLKAGEVWLLHAHGLARAQRGAARGSQLGLVEAFVQYRPELTGRTRLRATAGLVFPPTSRENVEPLWASPYTLTLSALNTWIGEELRLGGAELGVAHRTSRDDFLAAVMVFGASDSAGALLAWRGWALGDRLSSVDETLPLPPLPTLARGAAFGDQRADGTRPIDELDGRPGFQARARWSRPGRALLQASYLDTRGDRALHRGQYAWDTRFASFGAELRLGPRFILVAEGAHGRTGMGALDAAHVDLDFDAGYVLASWTVSSFRLSGRYDRFQNRDRDHTAEPGQEDGEAVTVALLWQPTTHLRLGVEGLRLWNPRPAAAFSGAREDAGAKRILAELRLRF